MRGERNDRKNIKRKSYSNLMKKYTFITSNNLTEIPCVLSKSAKNSVTFNLPRTHWVH